MPNPKAGKPKTEESQNGAKSDESVSITARISEINQLKKKNGLKAFWISSMMLENHSENEEVQKSFLDNYANVLSMIEENVKKEKWIDVFSESQCCGRILEGNDYSFMKDKTDIAKIQKYYDQSKKIIFESNVAYLKKVSDKKTEKISKLINGTVTIWVDLGVKIESGRAFNNRAIGSGFFIDSRGYLVTNYHVISSEVNPKYEGVSKLYIKFADDSESKIPAKVVGYDKMLDLALLKTEVPPEYVFSLGVSTDLDIGDRIYAIGSPIGLERTLTSGIVSADGRQLFSIGTVLQIDAAINQGNSGGPIIDENGNVQGIAFAGMLEYEGLNFAIPVEYLKVLLPRMYCGDSVQHSYIGVFGKTKKNEGVEVLWVSSKGNAMRSGLKRGDVITAVNGVKTPNLEMLHWCLVNVIPGSIIDLSVNSVNPENPEKFTAKKICVFTDVRQEFPGFDIYEGESLERSMYPLYGMELERNSSFYKNRYIVKSVVKGSIADEAGFSEMDPVYITRAMVQEVQEKKVLICEIMSKKKSNGYLDVSLVLPCMLDSENLF